MSTRWGATNQGTILTGWSNLSTSVTSHQKLLPSHGLDVELDTEDSLQHVTRRGGRHILMTYPSEPRSCAKISHGQAPGVTNAYVEHNERVIALVGYANTVFPTTSTTAKTSRMRYGDVSRNCTRMSTVTSTTYTGTMSHLPATVMSTRSIDEHPGLSSPTGSCIMDDDDSGFNDGSFTVQISTADKNMAIQSMLNSAFISPTLEVLNPEHNLQEKCRNSGSGSNANSVEEADHKLYRNLKTDPDNILHKSSPTQDTFSDSSILASCLGSNNDPLQWNLGTLTTVNSRLESFTSMVNAYD